MKTRAVNVTRGRRALSAAAVAVAGWAAVSPAAAGLIIAGSPTYDSTTGNGLRNGEVLFAPGAGVNNSGTAVGYSYKFVSGSNVGQRAVRWDASGTATELGNLGLSSGGFTEAQAYAVNDAGTAVGYSASTSPAAPWALARCVGTPRAQRRNWAI